MAKVKMAHIIAEARGKVGGTVFSRNTFGAYIRAFTVPVNPQTTAQQAVRNQLTQIAQAWRGLTPAQRTAWNQGAINFQHTDIFGDSVPLTGFSLYMQLNRNLLAAGEPTIDDIPVPSDVFGFLTLAVVADTTGGTFVLNFTDPIPAGTTVIVYATAGQSPGKNFVRSEFRQITTMDSTILTGVDLAGSYTAVFGALPAIGTKAFVEVRAITEATGQAGTRLKAEDIAV